MGGLRSIIVTEVNQTVLEKQILDDRFLIHFNIFELAMTQFLNLISTTNHYLDFSDLPVHFKISPVRFFSSYRYLSACVSQILILRSLPRLDPLISKFKYQLSRCPGVPD